MKKILLLIVPVLLITGCDGNREYKYNENDRLSSVYNNGKNKIIVDSETCVEYFSRIYAGTTVMYNADGTLKLNQDCLKEVEE